MERLSNLVISFSHDQTRAQREKETHAQLSANWVSIHELRVCCNSTFFYLPAADTAFLHFKNSRDVYLPSLTPGMKLSPSSSLWFRVSPAHFKASSSSTPSWLGKPHPSSPVPLDLIGKTTPGTQINNTQYINNAIVYLSNKTFQSPSYTRSKYFFALHLKWSALQIGTWRHY